MKIYWTDCHAHRCVPEDIFPHELFSHTTLSSNYPLCAHNILNESSKLRTEVCGLSLHHQTTNIWIDAPIAWMALFVSAFQIDIRLQIIHRTSSSLPRLWIKDLIRSRVRIGPGHPHGFFPWNKKLVSLSKSHFMSTWPSTTICQTVPPLYLTNKSLGRLLQWPCQVNQKNTFDFRLLLTLWLKQTSQCKKWHTDCLCLLALWYLRAFNFQAFFAVMTGHTEKCPFNRLFLHEHYKLFKQPYCLTAEEASTSFSFFYLRLYMRELNCATQTR